MSSPRIFISYSHKDKDLMNDLIEHLSVLQQQGSLEVWSDLDIKAGENWEEEIERAIENAQIAILLVSSSFLSSKFIQNREIPKLLERHEKEGLCIFPVIARHCIWQDIPWLAKFNARPKDGDPLLSSEKPVRDLHLTKIVREIYQILESTTRQVSGPIRTFKYLQGKIKEEESNFKDISSHSKKISNFYPWVIAGPCKEIRANLNESEIDYHKLLKLAIELSTNLVQFLFEISFSSYKDQSVLHNQSVNEILKEILKDNISMSDWWKWLSVTLQAFDKNPDFHFIPEIYYTLRDADNYKFTPLYSNIIEAIPKIKNINEGYPSSSLSNDEAKDIFDELYEMLTFILWKFDVLSNYSFFYVKDIKNKKYGRIGKVLTPDPNFEIEESYRVDIEIENAQLYNKHIYLNRKECIGKDRIVVVSNKDIIDLHPFIIYEYSDEVKDNELFQIKNIQSNEVIYRSFKKDCQLRSTEAHGFLNEICKKIAISISQRLSVTLPFEKKEEFEKIDLSDLKEKSEIMIKEFISEIKKFSDDKYVAREIDGRIIDFIDNDKKAMVLTGLSGRGKTFSILNLIHTYRSEDLFILPTNCSLISERSFEDLISYLFHLTPGNEIKFMKFLNDFLNSTNKKILFIFEELSDYNIGSPKELLIQLNRYIKDNSLTQIKFVITCRYDLWSTIEHYITKIYFQLPNPELTAWEISSFTDDEAEQAFHLITEGKIKWQYLPEDLKKLFHEPFLISLYEIIDYDSSSFHYWGILEEYFKWLFNKYPSTERLVTKASSLILNQRKKYISIEILDPDNKFDTELRRLYDIGLFQKNPDGRIKFYYDRYLDFLVAKSISHKFDDDEIDIYDLEDIKSELSSLKEQKVNDLLYLNALKLIYQRYFDKRKFVFLAHNADFELSSFLSSILFDLVYLRKDEAFEVIKALVQTKSITAINIAIPVIQQKAWITLLEYLFFSDIDILHDLAFQTTYYISKSDHIKVLDWLKELYPKVRTGVKPKIKTFVLFAKLLLLIYVDHYNSKDISIRIQDIALGLLSRILFVKDDSSDEGIRKSIRSAFLDILFKIVVKEIEGLSDYVNCYNEFSAFFPDDKKIVKYDKNKTREITLELTDVLGLPFKLEKFRNNIDNIKYIFKTQDVVGMFVAERVLILAGHHDIKEAIPVISDQFENGTLYNKMSVLYILFHILDKTDDIDENIFQLFKDYLTNWTILTKGRFPANHGKYIQYTLKWYLSIYWKRKGSPNPDDTILDLIDYAVQEKKDLELIEYIIKNTGILIERSSAYELSINVLKLLYQYRKKFDSNYRQLIINELSIIYNNYKTSLEFMRSCGFEDELLNIVQNTALRESKSDMFTNKVGDFEVAGILFSTEVNRFICSMIRDTCLLRNIDDCIIKNIKKLLNIIAKKEII